MNDREIIDLFDSTNITLEELSNMTGRTINSLIELLMEEDK